MSSSSALIATIALLIIVVVVAVVVVVVRICRLASTILGQMANPLAVTVTQGRQGPSSILITLLGTQRLDPAYDVLSQLPAYCIFSNHRVSPTTPTAALEAKGLHFKNSEKVSFASSLCWPWVPEPLLFVPF
ncbi:hypothetical protein Tco_1522472 [Tanacetum coccineum]